MVRLTALIVWSILISTTFLNAQIAHPLDGRLSEGRVVISDPESPDILQQTTLEPGMNQSVNTQNSITSSVNWASLGSGVDAAVWAIATLGTQVYAGGSFTYAGGTTVNRIALWDGILWHSLGTGMAGPNPQVYAIAIDSPSVYAGGSFISAGGVSANAIARWDSGSWHALGSGLSKEGYGLVPTVAAIAALDGYIYVGGSFTGAGGIAVLNIARWNGTTWEALGDGLNGTVRALTVMSGNLYVAGSFDSSGTTRLPHIAMWNGTTWESVGGGIDYDVFALAVKESTLYAGGLFTLAGTTPANSIAQWDGITWDSLGSGVDGVIYGLSVSGSDIMAGGFFTTAGGIPANSVAKWNGSGWESLDTGVDNVVFASSAVDLDVYFGGTFLNAGGISASRIVRYLNLGNTTLILAPGWNLVSVPRIQPDYDANVVFPGKYGSMYSYNTTTMVYDLAPILANGPGYWVNYLSIDTVTINGSAPGALTIPANRAGWVLVGSRASALPISSLILSDGAAVNGNAYRFVPATGFYESTAVINPGEACWVNVTKACTITLP